MSDIGPSPHAVAVRGLRAGHLAGLDLAVAGGTFVAVLGRGASELIRVVAGLMRHDAGEVWVSGRLLAHTPAFRRRFGVAGRNSVLFPHLTVAGNAALPLRLGGTRRGEVRTRVRETLDMLALAPVADALPAALTALQKRRAALARALVSGPRVLLLDHPADGLSGADRRAFNADLGRVFRGLAPTTVLATDAPEEALALAGSVAVLHEGRVVQCDAPERIYEHPASPAIAAALGSVNVLHGAVCSAEDDCAEVRLASGSVVEAMAADGLAAGQACFLCVRPERIAVSHARAEEIGGYALPGVLQAVRFEGDRSRLELTLSDGTPMLVTRPALAGQEFTAGAAVSLAWPAQHARAYPA